MRAGSARRQGTGKINRRVLRSHAAPEVAISLLIVLLSLGAGTPHMVAHARTTSGVPTLRLLPSTFADNLLHGSLHYHA